MSNWSVQKYIEQNCNLHGAPIYNLFQWQQSVLVGGATQDAIIPKGKGENRKFIWVQEITFNTGLFGTAAKIDFFDTKYPTQILFSTYDVIGLQYSFQFDYLALGETLTIRANDPNIIFSIGYCTVGQMDKKTLEQSLKK